MRATDLARLDWQLRHSVRPIDLLAAALGYGLMLAFVVYCAIALLDWLDDRTAQAWLQVHTVLVWIDGGAR